MASTLLPVPYCRHEESNGSRASLHRCVQSRRSRRDGCVRHARAHLRSHGAARLARADSDMGEGQTIEAAMSDVLVLGGGPAGVAAALRAADLGAKTTLIARDEFGGMAANDGPIPVRTLAHAARLLREARQLERYGIGVGALSLDYSKLLG